VADAMNGGKSRIGAAFKVRRFEVLTQVRLCECRLATEPKSR
jgi:hypothetical protein